MHKAAALLTMWMALAPAWSPQTDQIADCYKRCRLAPTDPDMQRQEIVNLFSAGVQRRLRGDSFSGRTGQQNRVYQCRASYGHQVRGVYRFGYQGPYLPRHGSSHLLMVFSCHRERADRQHPDAGDAYIHRRGKRLESGRRPEQPSAALHRAVLVIFISRSGVFSARTREAFANV